MNILNEKNRVIISTQNNLNNLTNKTGRTIDADNKLVIYNYSFGLHQECVADFAEALFYQYPNANDISRSGNMIIYIAGPVSDKYDLVFYLPEKIEDYQLSLLEEIIDNLDEKKLSFLCVSKHGEKKYEASYVDNRINQFKENILDKYKEQVIR